MNHLILINYRSTLKLLLTLLLSTLFTVTSAISFANSNVSPNQQILDKRKVLIVISSDDHGYWLPEVIEPYELLQQAGFYIDIASPLGGQGKAGGSSRLSSQQQSWFKESSLKKELTNTLTINQVNSQNYQAVYFAGGAGPMFDFINNPAMQKLTAAIYENGGIVSADCHGIAALLNVRLSSGERLITGRKLTAKANHEEGSWARRTYPFLLEDKIMALGGNYSSKPKGQPHVVIDGRLITGQNPASAIPMTEQLIKALLRT
jgi:putative intracellular protease/amidase